MLRQTPATLHVSPFTRHATVTQTHFTGLCCAKPSHSMTASEPDITELTQAQEALRASERRFRVFVDHAADAFFVTDEQGRVIDINDRACQARGYTRDELLNMPPYEFLSDFNPAVVEERVRRILAGETIVFEERFGRKNGTTFECEVRGKAFWEGERAYIVYLPRDVTSRKRAEQALRESEERFRGTFENAAVGIVHSDVAGRLLRVNQKFCAIVGYSREELLRKTLRDIIHPDELAAHIEHYESSLAQNASPAFGVERRFLSKDGRTVWVEAHVSFQHDAMGRPEYLIGAVHDITERKRLDEAL